MSNPEKFKSEVRGKATDLYTLTNKNGMEVCITNFGGRIVSVMVPDKNDSLRDVVLGFDSVANYIDSINTPSDFGAAIGRYANRINKGKITVDGQEIQLPTNNFGHCLHGGPQGWQYQVYEGQIVNDSTVTMTMHSPDGDANFPGAVQHSVSDNLPLCPAFFYTRQSLSHTVLPHNPTVPARGYPWHSDSRY